MAGLIRAELGIWKILLKKDKTGLCLQTAYFGHARSVFGRLPITLLLEFKSIMRFLHAGISVAGDRRQSKRKRNAALASERSFLANQLDWAPPAYNDSPIELIDADGVTAVHNASMRVLEDIGIFLNDAALDVFTKQCCIVDYNAKSVRMDRHWVMQQVAKALLHVMITPRNPDRTIIFAGRYFNFWPYLEKWLFIKRALKHITINIAA